MARILCVEDNPQNMRLVRKILNHQGYDVLEAEDGKTGVRLAQEEEPDLILMDINLPDIDGLEATGIIKGDESLKNIPIVALTANAMYGDEERCLAAGCDGYISKPVSKSKLLDVVADFLAQREAAASAEADEASADTPADTGSENSDTPNTIDSTAKSSNDTTDNDTGSKSAVSSDESSTTAANGTKNHSATDSDSSNTPEVSSPVQSRPGEES